MLLTYQEYEAELKRMAREASNEARLRFAKETIALLHQSVAAETPAELTRHEQELLTEILAAIDGDACEQLRSCFKELEESTTADDVRAVEFHPDFPELLCAIDYLIEYQAGQDPGRIARIRINRVNSIDWRIDGLPENILSAPEMLAEYERQKRLLLGL